MSDENQAQAIWVAHHAVNRILDETHGDTRAIVRIAAQALSTAGAIEDRKLIQERDRAMEACDDSHPEHWISE